tara:strand:+ start:726 stop:1133 length:408 start_codon:yes stop_codon:yes gene_type:complete
MIWIMRVGYVIIVLLALILARSTTLNVRTDISQSETNILMAKFLEMLPPGNEITSEDMGLLQKQLNELDFEARKRTGAKISIKGKSAYWRQKDYEHLVVLKGGGVFGKDVTLVKEVHPASLDGVATKVTVEVYHA